MISHQIQGQQQGSSSLLAQQLAVPGRGIYAVCSAHPLVLEAAMRRAKADGSPLLIEATANQVNQFGGYTGMQPIDFITKVRTQARAIGLPLSQLIFGGDHLGPVVWRNEPAAAAMAKAETLIQVFVRAGFSKIHLDTSMSCADDPSPLPDAEIAARAARLCAVAQATWQAEQQALQLPPLVYVIGTEVPAPGGVSQLEATLAPTPVGHVQSTIALHQQAFLAAGLPAHIWQQVLAVVVQPGVEFDHSQVHLYQAQQAAPLTAFIQTQAPLVFEAHSTDYQTAEQLRALVQGRFAILKVGPELTFALREALFALSMIEDELLPANRRSQLRKRCKSTLLANPAYWQQFYRKPDWQLLYSFSDRIRYYWPEPALQAAVDQLLTNLTAPIPLPLLCQFMPLAYQAVLSGRLSNNGYALLLFQLDLVLARYADACGVAATPAASCSTSFAASAPWLAASSASHSGAQAAPGI